MPMCVRLTRSSSKHHVSWNYSQPQPVASKSLTLIPSHFSRSIFALSPPIPLRVTNSKHDESINLRQPHHVPITDNMTSKRNDRRIIIHFVSPAHHLSPTSVTQPKQTTSRKSNTWLQTIRITSKNLPRAIWCFVSFDETKWLTLWDESCFYASVFEQENPSLKSMPLVSVHSILN